MFFTLSIRIDLYNLDISKIVYLIVGMLYLSTLFIIGGIEKEKHYISKGVLLFGTIVETLYIIYLYIVGVNIYKYVIYLFLILLFVGINSLILKKYGKENYILQLAILCFYLVLFSKEQIVIVSIFLTIILVFIKNIILSYKNKKQGMKNKIIPIGFYLCVSNIITLILHNCII